MGDSRPNFTGSSGMSFPLLCSSLTPDCTAFTEASVTSRLGWQSPPLAASRTSLPVLHFVERSHPCLEPWSSVGLEVSPFCSPTSLSWLVLSQSGPFLLWLSDSFLSTCLCLGRLATLAPPGYSWGRSPTPALLQGSLLPQSMERPGVYFPISRAWLRGCSTASIQ